MKFLGYVLRNTARNPIRSTLTIASVAISLFLMTMLVTYLAINNEVRGTVKAYNRIITMSSQGFAQPVPIAEVARIGAMEGIEAASPLLWYGGKYQEETLAFAQFGIDGDTIFKIYDEYSIPPDQLKSFQQDRSGCVIGRKLSAERNLKIGDRIPLKGDIYPFDMNLTVRAIYDGPENRDLRACWFHWEYLEEGLKRDFKGKGAGNAGAVVAKCEDGDSIPSLCKKIDTLSLNSDSPTRTQSEEAFLKMFSEFAGDLRVLIRNVGLAVVFSLLCVSGNAMAMALRERTREVAVLRAIGFGKLLILFLVLAESVFVAVLGGVVGSIGSKFLFDFFDVSRYSAGFLPFFYVSWTTALAGLAVAATIGLLSGIVPAALAVRNSVIDGLRKVV
jgi:putative ABC transport system permease protein